jgi:predicted 3-demethylubiquinone-9 3-methyltransferase (glyoxalase superfamily)
MKMKKPITFLMFAGKAEEAMNFYVSIFEHSKIESITKYKANESGTEGTVMKATFSINGQEYMCIDSSVKHAFTFTAAISLYINCESEGEIDRLYGQLSQEGNIFMPLRAYPFSKKFGWIADKFGVSWQLNLLSTT